MAVVGLDPSLPSLVLKIRSAFRQAMFHHVMPVSEQE